MNTIARIIGSTRLGLLLFLLPPILLWMGAGSGEGGSAFASIVLGLGFVLLSMLHGILFDVRTMRGGQRPRLGILHDLGCWSEEISERVSLAVAGLVVLCGALLIGTRPSGSLVLLVLVGLVWFLTSGLTRRTRRWRLVFVEVLWALAMLIAPMMLFRGIVFTDETGLGDRAVHATGLYAVGLALFLLLCLLRDHPLDGSEGVRTTATLLGRAGVLALVFVLMGAFSLVSIRGVEAGLWHWSVATIGVIGGMATLLLVAQDGEDAGPGLWAFTSAVAGIFLIASGG